MREYGMRYGLSEPRREASVPAVRYFRIAVVFGIDWSSVTRTLYSNDAGLRPLSLHMNFLRPALPNAADYRR